jgi:hypothetical protein
VVNPSNSCAIEPHQRPKKKENPGRFDQHQQWKKEYRVNNHYVDKTMVGEGDGGNTEG